MHFKSVAEQQHKEDVDTTWLHATTEGRHYQFVISVYLKDLDPIIRNQVIFMRRQVVMHSVMLLHPLFLISKPVFLKFRQRNGTSWGTLEEATQFS